MKRYYLMIFACISLFISMSYVNASACSNEEIVRLKKTAANIKAVYEEKEKEMDPNEYEKSEDSNMKYTYDYFIVSFVNITEDFYIKYTNSYNEENSVIYYNNLKDGIYSFEWDDIDYITTISFEVYTSDSTACPGEKVSMGYLTLPKYNIVSDTKLCSEAKDLPECKKYIDKDYNAETQYNTITKYIEKMNKKEENKNIFELIWDFTKKHKLVVISGILVVVGVATFVVLKKRKGSDYL